MSPSATSACNSLCQSGNAARIIAPAARIPSRSGVTPNGGSWLMKSSARYVSTALGSPLVNSPSMKSLTTALLLSVVFMAPMLRRPGFPAYPH